MQVRQNACVTDGDHADLARCRPGSASARRPRRSSWRRPARAAARALMRRTTSAEGTTSSMRQPLVAPTSMNSMNRTMWPLPLKRRAIVDDRVVVHAALDDHVDLDRREARRPRRPRCPRAPRATGKSTSFIARNTASSSESRLTVTRCRPASRSARAFRASSEPFVVSVRSRPPRPARASRSGARGSRRSSGSPPVSRIFSTPCSLKIRASRVISSKLSTSLARQELVVRAEDVLRHAVRAAEVAAVGDRDAQVAQRPRERVHDLARRGVPSSPRRGGALRGARRRAG